MACKTVRSAFAAHGIMTLKLPLHTCCNPSHSLNITCSLSADQRNVLKTESYSPSSASNTGVVSIAQYVFVCLAGLSRSILASRKWPFPWLLTPWRRRTWETIPVMWKMVTAVTRLPSSSSGAVRALWRLPLQQVFACSFRLSGFEVEKKKYPLHYPTLSYIFRISCFQLFIKAIWWMKYLKPDCTTSSNGNILSILCII